MELPTGSSPSAANGIHGFQPPPSLNSFHCRHHPPPPPTLGPFSCCPVNNFKYYGNNLMSTGNSSSLFTIENILATRPLLQASNRVASYLTYSPTAAAAAAAAAAFHFPQFGTPASLNADILGKNSWLCFHLYFCFHFAEIEVHNIIIYRLLFFRRRGQPLHFLKCVIRTL